MSTTVEEANQVATDGKRFHFTKKIGHGAFGTVLRALDKQRQQPVAIKCVKASSGGAIATLFTLVSPQRKKMEAAWKEAQLLMKLRHQNILGFLKAYDFKDANGKMAIAIVTDYCEGGDLQKFLEVKGQTLGVAKRRQWFQELSLGLQYIHSKGVVHRDLKPGNILITSYQTLKIADVGLAKSFWEVQSNVGIIDEPFQEYMSSVAGTKPYMAPEVFASHYTEKSDIFSLGLVYVVITEVPRPVVPLAVFGGSSAALGWLYHTNTSLQYNNASLLLPMRTATPDEVKLFNQMLLCDYHHRLGADEVVRMVGQLGARAASCVQVSPDPPPESASWSCCS